jgi:hypothetical protein
LYVYVFSREIIYPAHLHDTSPPHNLYHRGAMAGSACNIDMLSIEANETQHDAVLDYYGRRLATCSSDKTIKIFEVDGDKHTLVETLRGYVVPYHGLAVADGLEDTRAPCGA